MIFDALENTKTLHLDFVYGSLRQTKKGTIFTPLDGQQRLTTLFLLHWYFGEAKENLEKFSYETRASSREFCEKLVNANIKKEKELSKQIKNQSWFMPFWEQDPTVSSMLNMLDSIANKADKKQIQANNLNKLTFSLMIIGDYGLDDDLYIKMNARGKPLNEFENFKAEFEKFLNKNHPDKVKEIAKSIDISWTHEFFKICKKGKNFNIEDIFTDMLNYINFLFEMLYYKNQSDQKGKITYNKIIDDKKNLNNVIKDDKDLDFIDNAFKNISKILDEAKVIFTEFWDGISEYDGNKVYIFKDKNDNFNNEVKVTINKKSIKKAGILERLPYETAFNIEHKVYLYFLICLIIKGSQNKIAVLSRVRDYIHCSNNFYYLRRGRVYYEQNNIYDNISKDIKKINDEIIEKNEPQNDSLKKLKDHKYFQGKIILGNLTINDSQKIIDFFNLNNSIIVANLVYRGFNGWVLGSVYGGEGKDYAKRLFGGKDLWHTMLTKETDFVEDDSLKSALKAIIENGYKEEFSDDDYKKFQCDDWKYYFIKYANDLFKYDKNILAWYGGRTWDDVKYENKDLKGDKLSLKITKLMSNSGVRNEGKDKLIFEQILEEKGKNNIELTNIALNEDIDIINYIIQN